MNQVYWMVFNNTSEKIPKEGKTSKELLLEYLNKEDIILVLNRENFNNLGKNFGYAKLYAEELQGYADRCK